MKKLALGIAVSMAVIYGGYTMISAAGWNPLSCSSGAKVADGSACDAGGTAADGKVAGRFDPAMSGVCKFACATKLEYQAADVIPQPGAKPGRLTQCPVSGVVFAVDEHRPHVRIAGGEYVTCCEGCAKKLRAKPSRYLRI